MVLADQQVVRLEIRGGKYEFEREKTYARDRSQIKLVQCVISAFKQADTRVKFGRGQTKFAARGNHHRTAQLELGRAQ